MGPARRPGFLPIFCACALTVAATTGVAQETDTGTFKEEIVVTSNRGPKQALDQVGNISRLDEERLRITNAVHPYELAVQIPATWVSRGSGQEHLTAIRSPVLTGPGSCGAFLILEDGIPTRPSGFCNVNQLFELDTEQAAALEVVRGPTNAMYGGNGLHGAFNVLLPEPGSAPGFNASFEGGPNDYRRGKFGWDSGDDDNGIALGLVGEHDGGFRDDSGFDQVKAFLRGSKRYDWGDFDIGFSGSWLDQETAGFIQGENAYKDPDIRTTNPNPEAFRKADSQRLFARWTPDSTPAGWSMDYRAFLRHSDMEFRMHFVPDKSLEENGQVSIGTMITARRSVLDDATLTAGIDLELADAFLKETQQDPDVVSGFGGPTRPTGKHYDYDVLGTVVAPYAQLDLPFADSWELQLGLRLEWVRYDYDNNMIAGNTREDGTGCGPPGCLYNRPESGTDDFFNAAPNVGLLYHINDSSVLFGNLVRGFRPPQATELYRLQRDQNIADIDSETIDSLEFGYRYSSPTLQLEAVAFGMKKQDYILRDANGFNVSDGKSDHYGVEGQFRWRPWEPIYFAAVGSYAKHKYDFDRDAALGEQIVSGNEVDTAPQVLASARIGYEQRFGLAELEWVHMDPYFLNAANSEKYEGHDLLNFRLIITPTPSWNIALRVNNLTDELYADRADFAFGNHRYFPGREREVYIQVGYRSR